LISGINFVKPFCNKHLAKQTTMFAPCKHYIQNTFLLFMNALSRIL